MIVMVTVATPPENLDDVHAPGVLRVRVKDTLPREEFAIEVPADVFWEAYEALFDGEEYELEVECIDPEAAGPT